MKKYLTDEWAAIRTWWSVWVGVFSAGLVAIIPVLADNWPSVAPGFVALFPKNGEQIAPVIGLVLTVGARLVSQRAVIDQMRKVFARKAAPDGEKQ